VGVAAAVACTRSNPSADCHDGACTDPNYPYCDVDGAIDGEPNKCIAVSCTPGTFGACDGSNALICGSDGSSYGATTCAAGCDASENGCHVVRVEPRYLPGVCDAPATSPSLVVPSSGTIDSDLDATCNGGVVMQSGAPSICVAHYGTISIASGATLTVTSSYNQTNLHGGRAIAFVADGDLSIDGTLDVSAHTHFSGPGGGVVDESTCPLRVPEDGGCGGAGFQTPGGAGGDDTTDGGLDNGGAATMDPALFTYFGGGPSTQAGGGGAVLLVSCAGTVSLTGTLAAGGGGGEPIFAANGGGAGGYGVMIGVNVSVTGSVYANGGGGCSTAKPGEDGMLSDETPAPGGQGSSGGGDGGAGGIGSTPPGVGEHSTMANAYGGAGGGSVGYFQTYTPAGVTPTLTPAHASPAFQPNGTVPTE
ncbi:MAG TPA: hypothetical protein VLX92_21380, partial [Kofleriaceae bacterium]|nr:hypothetical protein [Kofleriaceae bacterium]